MFSPASALLSVCMWSPLYLCGTAQTYWPCGFLNSKNWMVLICDAALNGELYEVLNIHVFPCRNTSQLLFELYQVPLWGRKAACLSEWFWYNCTVGWIYGHIYIWTQRSSMSHCTDSLSVAINQSFQWRCLSLKQKQRKISEYIQHKWDRVPFLLIFISILFPLCTHIDVWQH